MTTEPITPEAQGENTHRAVIESATGTRLTVIGAGPRDFCRAVLADYTADWTPQSTDAPTTLLLAVDDPTEPSDSELLVQSAATMLTDAFTGLHGEPREHPAVSHTTEAAALALTSSQRLHLLRGLAVVSAMLLDVEAGEREDA